MSTPKHTPGPWLRDGNTIYALMHDGWRKGVELFRNRFFAQVHSDVSCDAEEAIANASLMSAAPDMWKALKLAQERLIAKCEENLVAFNGKDVEALEAIGDALAKAAGQTK